MESAVSLEGQGGTEFMTVEEQSIAHDKESKPVCGAKKRGGEGCCMRPAGWGTHHVGVGVCKLHGGSTPIKTDGSRSKYLQHDVDIQARVQELKESKELTDLRSEIAITVAMLERAVELIDKNEGSPMDAAKSVSQISTNLARIVEIKHKIETGYFLSPEQQALWLKQLVRVINEEITDDSIKQRIGERMAALPSVIG